MSDEHVQYLELREELRHIRWKHGGAESTEEDALLDRMDLVWARLTAREIRQLNQLDPIPVDIPAVAFSAKSRRIYDDVTSGVRRVQPAT